MSEIIDIPAISVILPVFNAEAYLAASIQSILKQSFKNFELIIVNDGSTDRSEEIIRSFTDERIKYITHSNRGLAASLNKAIGMARAEIIARQDNDDISYPDRLQKQWYYLQNNTEVALLGAWARVVDQNGNPNGTFHRHPTSNLELNYFLLFDNPFVHSSVMFRKSIWTQSGGYQVDPNVFEDYQLWSKMSRVIQIANLPEVLLDYREVQTGMSKSSQDYDQKVEKQSFVNLQDLCDTIASEKLKSFLEMSLSRKEEKEIFQTINQTFCKKHQVDAEAIRPIYERIHFERRRKKYNQILNAASSSPLDKWRARCSRYVLFKSQGPS